MGFSDLFQTGNGKSPQLLQVVGPFFTIVVLFNRSPIVEISALIRQRRVVFSTTYDWRLNCHLSDASCDCDEEPDAEDHEKGKRRSGL